MMTLEQLCGGERGERERGGMDGDVRQWYRPNVSCRWGCVS